MASLGQRHSGFATGVTVFAAAMLMFAGLSQALWGIAALFNDEFLAYGGPPIPLVRSQMMPGPAGDLF